MARDRLRYEVNEPAPTKLAIGLGLQLAVLCINSVVLVAAIVFRAAGAEEQLLWGVFATVLACGVSTAVQAARPGRLGAGYVIFHGTSSTFIAVCVTALADGGPAMLATLVVVSGLLQAALSDKLPWLRKLLTPVVTGTVIMLLPVTVMPILFRMLHETPPGASTAAGPTSALVTIAVVVAIVLKGTGPLRLWAPALGVVAGSLVAALFGAYDMPRVAQAPWIGLPPGSPPGLDLAFGPAFWSLLPGFLLVTLVGTTKSIGVAVATQRVSWRRPRAVDFRAVQRTVATEGVGNVLAGALGTMPNTPFPACVSVTQITGVAARRVGVAAGAALVVLAFLPKALALILAIPSAVVAASIMVVMAMLFSVGLREVAQAATGVRGGLIAGVSFWAGVAFQFGLVYPDFFARFASGMLTNGMTTGGATALVLVALVQMTGPRPKRFKGQLHESELPRIREFLGKFAEARGLTTVQDRMEAAAEETLLTLIQSRDAQRTDPPARPQDAAPPASSQSPGPSAPAQDTGAAPPSRDTDAAPPSRDTGAAPRRDTAPAAPSHDTAPSAPSLLVTARREDDAAVLEFVSGADAGGTSLNVQDQMALLGEVAEEAPPEQEISLRLLRHLASSVRHQQFHHVDVVTLRVSVT